MKKKMRLTRKSYNRKLALFGASMLASLALISTGFASWVISLGADRTDGGEISVGVVQDQAIRITDSNGKDDETADFISSTSSHDADLETFYFEPEWDDNDGVFIRNNEKGAPYEHMAIIVSGRIYNASAVKGFAIKLEIPSTVKAAADAGYIVLPDCVSEDGVIANENDIMGSNSSSAISFSKPSPTSEYVEFSYVIEITWGNAFAITEAPVGADAEKFALVSITDSTDVVKNPWIYYEEVMATIPSYSNQLKFAEVAKTKINAFRKAMYGLSEEDDPNMSTADIKAKYGEFKYTVTIVASSASLSSEETE